MKHTILVAFLGLSTLARAATVVAGDPVDNTYDPVTFAPLDGGLPYRMQVEIGANDTGSFQRHVGGWSWEDNTLFNAALGEAPVGWTHTADWVLVTLSAPATLTLRMEAQAGVPAPSGSDPAGIAGIDSMFPSFTIYSGLDHTGPDNHTFNNRGNVSWADGISYLDHLDNSIASMAERSWALPAGSYSVVLGSNAPAGSTVRQGYQATFTTTPIPEPTALVGLSLALSLRLARRKRSA
jgi:hypothetical protein